MAGGRAFNLAPMCKSLANALSYCAVTRPALPRVKVDAPGIIGRSPEATPLRRPYPAGRDAAGSSAGIEAARRSSLKFSTGTSTSNPAHVNPSTA